jgi:hypothetical protein
MPTQDYERNVITAFWISEGRERTTQELGRFVIAWIQAAYKQTEAGESFKADVSR